MMEHSIKIKVATISLWNYAAIVITIIACMFLYMKANRNNSLKAFLLVEVSMLIWLIGKVFKTVSPNADIRWAFIVFYYFGICMLEATFLDFSVIYSKGKPLKKLFRVSLYGMAFIQFIIVLTNPYHYLFYYRYSFWGDDFGKLFYVHVVINYSCIIAGMVLCSRKFNAQMRHKDKFKNYIVGVAILAPIIFNFIYISDILKKLFKILGIQVFDITPLIFTWSLLIFVYATFKYEFFDLTPIMKHEVTDRLNTPICIVDSEFNIIFANNQLMQNFGLNIDNHEFKLLLKRIKHGEDENIMAFNNKYYKYNINRLKSKIRFQYIITFTDVTSYQIAHDQLSEGKKAFDCANDKLESQIEMLKQTSHINATNYVARELHDIMGHSLVVTMKLLEVCKIFYKGNRHKIVETLQKAKQSTATGFNDMKCLQVKKEKDMIRTGKSLEIELKNILKIVELSGIKTNFFFRGMVMELNPEVYDTIKKVSSELITNVMKHAQATMILYTVTFDDDAIRIQLMDNGSGSASFVKGNGLDGVDSRLSQIQGTATYITNKNEGLNINIVIPLICDTNEAIS